MLKYLFFLLPAFAFPACSSENPNLEAITPEYGDDVIRFASPRIAMDAPEVQTRSTLLDAVTENTEFGVFGYCVPYSVNDGKTPAWDAASTDWAGQKKEYSHADVMYNQAIFYDGTKCVYRGHETDEDLPKHWYSQAEADKHGTNLNAEQFKYSFIAYHPYNPDKFTFTPTDAATRGVPKMTYKVPHELSDDITQRLDLDLVQDVMFAVKENVLRGSGAVQLEFRHILTGLRLQVNNYNPTDENAVDKNSVTIHSITLEGKFYYNTTIDFAPATPTMTVGSETYAGTFHFLEEDANWKVPATSGRVVGSTPDKANGTTILLIPNAKAVAEGASDAVPYLGKNKTITVDYTFNGKREQKHIRDFSLGRIPESGICYTINLNFIGNQLLLMFTADSIEYWEPGSDNNIIIN